jgi:hypothetical protein
VYNNSFSIRCSTVKVHARGCIPVHKCLSVVSGKSFCCVAHAHMLCILVSWVGCACPADRLSCLVCAVLCCAVLCCAVLCCAVQKTAAHFSDLKRRYGDPIIVLNLLKSKERR